jgi:hypothetical protein
MICSPNIDKEDYWETETKEIKECSRAESVTYKMSLVLKLKIDALMEKYKNREWLGYLLGDKETRVLSDIFIPKQIATITHVEPREFPQDSRIIGVIHSHHNMGHNFSHTDDEFINQNHHISIVVSNSGYSGKVRTQTPCGCTIKVPVKIEVEFGVPFDKETFVKDLDAKIREPKVVVKADTSADTHKIPNRRKEISSVYEYLYGGYEEDEEDDIDEMIRKEIELAI